MSQEPPKNPMEQVALALYYHAAQLIKEGKTREEIIADLMSKGVNQETAESMLVKLDISRANVARRSGYRNVLMGTAIVIVSLLPLFGIYIAQAIGFQFWGAVIILAVGIFLLGRGIMQVTGL